MIGTVNALLQDCWHQQTLNFESVWDFADKVGPLPGQKNIFSFIDFSENLTD